MAFRPVFFLFLWDILDGPLYPLNFVTAEPDSFLQENTVPETPSLEIPLHFEYFFMKMAIPAIFSIVSGTPGVRPFPISFSIPSLYGWTIAT